MCLYESEILLAVAIRKSNVDKVVYKELIPHISTVHLNRIAGNKCRLGSLSLSNPPNSFLSEIGERCFIPVFGIMNRSVAAPFGFKQLFKIIGVSRRSLNIKLSRRHYVIKEILYIRMRNKSVRILVYKALSIGIKNIVCSLFISKKNVEKLFLHFVHIILLSFGFIFIFCINPIDISANLCSVML